MPGFAGCTVSGAAISLTEPRCIAAIPRLRLQRRNAIFAKSGPVARNRTGHGPKLPRNMIFGSAFSG